MDDTASKNVAAIEAAKLIAEEFDAKRASKEVPKSAQELGYDPKAIAQELWNRLIDKRFVEKTFEELWNAMHSISLGPVLGYVTEHECRVFLKCTMHTINGIALREVAAKELKRAEIHHNTGHLLVDERMGFNMKKSFRCDLRTGTIHEIPAEDAKKMRAFEELLETILK